MALARLLAPEDFGLFAMAAAFFGFLLLFRDAGVEPAFIRERTVSAEEQAALASFCTCTGLALAIVCAALGPALAALYGEPRLAPALLLPGVAFLFHGLAIQPAGLLLRAHRFRMHAIIETGAVFIGWGVTLGLAVGGAGYWALFATEAVIAASLLLGHGWAARWHPHFSFAWGHTLRFVQFGRDVSVVRALDHVARNVDNLLLGLTTGPVSLAFYNRAFRLIGLPQEGVGLPLSRLAVTQLSALRDQPAEFVRSFRHFTLTSIALGLPLVAFLLVATAELVEVMYGPQWASVTPLVQLLAVMGVCNSFHFTTGWVFTAMGTVRRQIHWSAVNLVILAVAFLVGIHWGATGVAVAASLAYGGLRVPSLLYCFRGTPVRLRDVGAVLWRPLLASLVGAGLVLGVRAAVGQPAAALAAVGRDGLVFAAGHVLGWVLVPGWKGFLRHELRRPDPVA